MNKDIENTVDTVLMVCGTGFAMTDIRNILSIAILVVEAIWFTVKLVYMIVDHAKKKDTKEVLNDVKTYSDELTSLVEKIDEEEKKKGDTDGGK